MLYLAITSLVWAVSFGLIKGVLGGVDSSFAAAARLLLALLVFLPFLRPRAVRDWRLGLQLAAIGAVQYGLMYLLYMRSFQYLQAHEVALFTCLTPVFVTLLDDAENRRFHPVFLLVATLAAVGMALAVWPVAGLQGKAGAGLLGGLWLVQGSNLCFAYGQVRYRNLLANKSGLRDLDGFALLYLGAFAMALIPALMAAQDAGGLASMVRSLTAKQAWTLVWLGVLASGVCFFLWNFGARRTNTGALAVFNDVKIPLAVICSLLLFGEKPESLPRLGAGSFVVVGALALNEWLLRRRV